MNSLKRTSLGIAALATAVAGGAALYAISGGAPAPDFVWVQLGGSGASVRAVVEGAACPTIAVDGAPAVAMAPRAAPGSYTGFEGISVCEFVLPASAKTIAVGGVSLPAPTGKADRALLLGDTGCRLKGGDQQDCLGPPDEGGWGFPAISKAAAKVQSVDLVVHVGDYIYRESADKGQCVPLDPAKGWVHCGDNWPTWKADFFAPAHDGGLLAQAPWIPTRGNHEDCGRAWQGYMLFFAEGAPQTTCATTLPVQQIPLAGLDVLMVDTSSEGHGGGAQSELQASYSEVTKKLGQGTAPAWLVTHVPTYMQGYAPYDIYANSGLGANSRLKWLQVGHVHDAQHCDGVPGSMQPQTVVGGSGVELDHCGSGTSCAKAGVKVEFCSGPSSAGGGYSFFSVQADAAASKWQAQLLDLQGQPTQSFSVNW